MTTEPAGATRRGPAMTAGRTGPDPGPAGRGGRAKSIGLGDALAAYVVAHGTPPDEHPAGADRGDRGGSGGRRHADRARAGRVADAAGPAARRPPRGRGRHVHRLLGAVPGPRPAAGRAAARAATSATSGPSVGRPFWERAGVADRIELRLAPGARDARGPARRTRSSTWPSSTPTRPATAATTRSCCPACARTALMLVDNVLWGGARHRPRARQDADTAGDPGLQRRRRRRRARRRRDAPHRRRPHPRPQALSGLTSRPAGARSAQRLAVAQPAAPPVKRQADSRSAGVRTRPGPHSQSARRAPPPTPPPVRGRAPRRRTG